MSYIYRFYHEDPPDPPEPPEPTRWERIQEFADRFWWWLFRRKKRCVYCGKILPGLGWNDGPECAPCFDEHIDEIIPF